MEKRYRKKDYKVLESFILKKKEEKKRKKNEKKKKKVIVMSHSLEMNK